MEAQRGDQGSSSSTGTTFLRKGKSDSLVVGWTSFERKLQATNSMKGVVNRKDNAFHLRPASYPLFDMECEGGHSSASSPYKNMISRTSSATASLSLGIAGPLIFPSEHALTSIIDGSCTSKGEDNDDDDDDSDESKGNSTMTYQLHEKHIPPTAQAHSIPIDVGNDDHNVLSPSPISLKFVNVTYKVAIDDEHAHSRFVSYMMKRAAGGGRSSSSSTGAGGGGGGGGGGQEMRRKRKTKKILKGITGYVLPGEVLALMGPSGSGKTTLLNLLSGRLNIASSHHHHHHLLHGSITYNDLPYSKALKRRMGFVMQDDVLYPHLTVKETLTYAAILRLPKKLSKKQRMERAMEVIYELGLERCQDTMIGGPFLRGVSGGERKRVCMGQEILIDPSLLFLDEPTSGLDSTTALRIIHMLRRISQVGRTVVTTIHQPSSRLFHMFHKLILISEGHLIYFGEARAAMDYFSSIGFSPQLAMNPADFLLDLASGNVIDMSLPTHLQDTQTSPTMPSQALLAPHTFTKLSTKIVRQYLSKAYEASWELEERSKLVEDQLSMKEKSGGAMLLMKEREWSSTWWSQFWVLYVRGMRERRHEYLSLLRVFQVVISALIIGCLWWHSDILTERHLADQVGLLFFIATYWGFFPLFTALFTFPQERAILAKERACDMYRLSAYFMARTLGDIPLDFCLPLIFHIIVYFMASLRLTASAFFLTLLTILLSTIAAQGLGIAIGAVLMDLKKATTLASVALLTFMLSGGFFVQRIPTFISWIRYISYNYHTFKLLVKVQYDDGQHIDCDTPIGCRKVVNSLIFHDLSLDGGVQEVLVLLSMIVGYRLIAYVALRHMRLVV